MSLATLNRHFLRHVAINFLVIAPALLALFWLVQAPRFAEISLERGWSALTVLWLLFLLIWRYVDLFLPLALFLAVASAFITLEDDSEVIAAQALGMSQRKIAKSVLMMAGFVSCLLVVNTMIVAPTAFKRFMDLRETRSIEFFSAALQAEQFITLTDGVTLWMEGRTASGDLRNLMIRDRRDPNRPSVLYARNGRISLREDGFHLLLADGVRHELHNTNDNRQADKQTEQELPKAYWLKFHRHNIVLERPPATPRRTHRVELSLLELFARADGASSSATPTETASNSEEGADRRGEFLGEAHRRLALFLWPPAFALLALVSVLGRKPANRRYRMSLAFSLAIVLILFADFWLELVTAYPILVAGIYIIPLAVIAVSWFILSLQDNVYPISPRPLLEARA